MKNPYLNLAIVILLAFVSCKTDIDVNAPYQDIPVVYGVIDPADSVHYIKVNKAFLGEISALDLAADASNFNYADGEIDVIIEEWNGGSMVGTPHSLIRTVNEIPKDPGGFDNSQNVLYKFIESSINKNNTYKLKVINNTLNKEITAETEIVKTSNITDPVNTIGKFQFWIGNLSTGAAHDKTIKVTTAKDIGRVEAMLVFNYNEYYTTSSGLTPVSKRIEMPLGERKSTTTLGNDKLKWKLAGTTFFDNIRNNISSPQSVSFFSHREIWNISLEFNVAGTELSTFMDVNEPSTSVNQGKPNYSNVTNGIGIFSSRTKMLWVSSIDPIATNQVNVQNATIRYLESLNLGFCFGSSGTGFPVSPCQQQP